MTAKGQYRIGQVLFVVPKDRAAVVPVKVVEELLRKTEEGETIVYTVSWRVGRETKTAELDNVSGEVFDNPHRLRRTLIKRSTVAITRMVEVACKRATEYGFKVAKDQPPESRPPRSRSEKQDAGTVTVGAEEGLLETVVDDRGEAVNVQLPDGSTARVRI